MVELELGIQVYGSSAAWSADQGGCCDEVVGVWYEWNGDHPGAGPNVRAFGKEYNATAVSSHEVDNRDERPTRPVVNNRSNIRPDKRGPQLK